MHTLHTHKYLQNDTNTYQGTHITNSGTQKPLDTQSSVVKNTNTYNSTYHHQKQSHKDITDYQLIVATFLEIQDFYCTYCI